MAHPLAGIRLKIIRALDQLRELHDEGAEFVGKHPYGLRFEGYLDHRTREPRVRGLLTISEHPPLHLSVLAGEAVYHLRGVLDHLVYQLALLNKRSPSGTQFPLAIDKDAYWNPPAPGKKSPRDSMLQGVRKEHRTIIDEFQPYHDGPAAKQSPLYVIGQFANADKHRVLQIAAGLPSSIKVEPTAEGVDLDIRYARLVAPVNEGTEIFSVRWINGYDDVPMHYEIVMSLVYGTGLPDFVSRLYIVKAAVRINQILERFTEEVPEFGDTRA